MTVVSYKSIYLSMQKILKSSSRDKNINFKNYNKNELTPTEKLCAYKSNMFSKASRHFFKENQEIRYTFTDKF